MAETWPDQIGFQQGEGGQTSFSLYLHGSPDGGWEEYSALMTPATWDDDDGGFGFQGADAGVSFAGHRLDSTGASGPYSPRLAALLLRPQPTPTRAMRAQLEFNFNGAGSGERVGILVRAVPAGLTQWSDRGIDGTEQPHFFESLVQGYAVVVEQGGTARVYEYDSTGARTELAAEPVTITGGAQTLSVEVSDDATPEISVLLDASDPFSGAVIPSETAPTRGHVGFLLTCRTGANYPQATAFQLEDTWPAVAVLTLRDEFARSPDLGGTIVPQTADGRATVSTPPHKMNEWGGNRISLESGEDLGPRLEDGALVYGPAAAAAPVASNGLHAFVNLELHQASADQFAALEWSFDALDSSKMLGRTAVGIALRCDKDLDGDPPDANNLDGYIMRAVFASPEPYFELLKMVAGAGTRIGGKRPFSMFDVLAGQKHIFTFEVWTDSGDVFLSAAWRKPSGDVVSLWSAEEDTAATYTGAGAVGHTVSWHAMGGQNPRVLLHRFSRASLVLAPPTLGGEATVAGASPHAPSFAQPTARTYQVIQERKERGYIASRPTFGEPRTAYDATWILNGADAEEQVEFLQARAGDRQAFTVELEDGDVTFILGETEYDVEQATPDLFRIGPVTLIESL